MVFFVFCLNYSDVCERCVGDLYFCFVEQVVVFYIFEVGNYIIWVGFMVWFGQIEVVYYFVCSQFWQVFFMLFFIFVFLDWVYYQGRLNGSGRVQIGVVMFEFLYDQFVGNLIEVWFVVFFWDIRFECIDFF